MSSVCAWRPRAGAWRTPRSRCRRSPPRAASAAQRRCAASSCARSRWVPLSIAAASMCLRRRRRKMQIAIVLYERFTALDAIGPYEVLSRLPGASVSFLAAERGPVHTDNGMLTLLAESSLEEIPRPDIVLVPGGPGGGGGGGRTGAGVAERGRCDERVDDICVHRVADPRRGGAARGQARDEPLDGDGGARAAGSSSCVGAGGIRRQDRHGRRRLSRYRHGARARGEGRRRGRGAGDSAGHRVRPSAAVRRRLAADRASRDRRAAARSQPLPGTGAGAAPDVRGIASCGGPEGCGGGRPLTCESPMAEHRYDPHEIEPRWQAVWAAERTWEVANERGAEGRAGSRAGQPKAGAQAPNSYVLEMLPYPSGEPHIGHLKCYAVGDAIAHFHRRLGRRVLHPMGYDAFGLPAENHAIKTGVHPRVSTAESIASFQRQFRSWGISIDWSRELATSEPSYYRWTQWIFLELFRAGLAYRKEAAVKWCPKDQTVLANEQVDAEGHCERCGALVEVRQLEQWFFRITDYAERLLNDLEGIDWPEHVKTMQRNWIGRSEGAEVTFHCERLGIDYSVFTTRPDTLFGATFFVMAPEHPDVMRLARGTEHEQAVHDYVNHALTETNEERGDAERPKTGVALGQTVTNPVNGEQIPMYVADYVLMEYGTGAIMAVPAHDERDYAFARAFELPIRRVIAPEQALDTAEAAP